MHDQPVVKIKKHLLLDWLYQQQREVPVTELLEFIKSHSNNLEKEQNIQKSA